jgi:hypothetical protein
MRGLGLPLLFAAVLAIPAAARAATLSARFEWSLPERFGVDRDRDGLLVFSTAHDYIYPPSWTVNFDACSSTAGGGPIVQYDWDLAGLAQVSTTSCAMPHPPSVFPAQGPYSIRLTVTAADGETSSFTDTIVIKDLLIVSLGDSAASGQGNPDVPQVLDSIPGFDVVKTDARWIDRRCARSAYSNHAQAAIAIERADPHTSVTFLSYACSGASVLEGLLGPYDGSEPLDTPGVPHELLPAQISALTLDLCRSAAIGTFPLATCPDRSGERRIDALLLSTGINDLGFGDLVFRLVTGIDADKDPRVLASFAANLAMLPGLYRQLGSAIREKLNAGTVYITEYPDPTTDEHGNSCGNAPAGDLLSGIGAEESNWASTTVLPSLNGAARAAADANGWIYVGGIASQFVGHGWCAGSFAEFTHDAHWSAYAPTQRWMRTYEDSRYTQGPFDLIDVTDQGTLRLLLGDSRGTMHPNAQGQAAIAATLAGYIGDPGPSFHEFDGLVPFAIDRQGDDGWLTGNCPVFGGDCSDAQVYVTVTIASPKGIDSPQPAACGGQGIACTYQVVDHHNGVDDEATWTINLSADGEHSIAVDAKDSLGKAGALVALAKVDLHDPVAAASVLSGTAGNGGWYRSPVDVELRASDIGSGMRSLGYRIDAGTSASTSATDPSATLLVPVSLRDDGRHSISFQAFDRAGRSSALQTLALNIDATPPVVTWSGNAGTYTVDQTVDVTCSAADVLSGIASSTCAAIVGPAYSFDLGVNTFSASAVDNAGNPASAETSFTVLVTIEGLSNLTLQFVANGGVAHALLVKLAAGNLQAYQHQIGALAGKMLTAEQAAILVRLAQAI